MKKLLIADLIKQVQEEIPVPGDLEDAGIENAIHLPYIGTATYEHNPEHDVYIVTLTLDKGGEVREYVLNPNGLKDLIELGTKYFYDEMESQTFDMKKSDPEDIDSSDIDPDGGEFDASIGSVTYQPNGDGSFEVDISFGLGGSATYTMDVDQLQDWINNASGGYYNANVRIS